MPKRHMFESSWSTPGLDMDEATTAAVFRASRWTRRRPSSTPTCGTSLSARKVTTSVTCMQPTELGLTSAGMSYPSRPASGTASRAGMSYAGTTTWEQTAARGPRPPSRYWSCHPHDTEADTAASIPSGGSSSTLSRRRLHRKIHKCCNRAAPHRLVRVFLPGARLWWPHTHSTRRRRPLHSVRVGAEESIPSHDPEAP